MRTLNEKEAIIIINRFKGITTAPVNTEEVREACALAIAALNKQVPRKAELLGTEELRYGRCPACGDVLCNDVSFCCCCGQSLDWE